MAITRWDPWGELATLQRDVQELFGLTSPQATRRPQNLVPAMDAYRDDDGVVLRFELPGIAPEQVSVDIDRGVLTVSGERSVDRTVEEANWIRRERSTGAFRRSVELPDGIEPDSVKARFENGVLEVRVPQPAERKAHKVQIMAGDDSAVDVGSSSSAEASAA